MLTLQEGQEVIGCTVVGPIGQGGMGTVYKVYDPRLAVHRALKIMALPPGTQAAAVTHYEKRFAQEAKNLAQLRHPSVVTVHAFGELTGPGSPQYLLMEYVHGRTLTDWLQEEHPSLDRVLHVAKQLASALKAIHGRGILHRDIKLTNLLVTKPHGSDEDHLIVIDFGLAKTDDDEKLTKTGAIAGTSWYLAPEYVAAAFDSNGEVAIAHTVLTDLWAVGCVLYSLCTHRSVWKAKSAITIHEEIRRASIVPIEDLRSDISEEFAAVVMGLLVPDPTKRIQSAGELLDKLQRVTVTTDPTKAPFVPPAAKRGPTAATVLASSGGGSSDFLTAPGSPAAGKFAGQPTVTSRPPQRAPQNALLDQGSLSEFSFPSALPDEPVVGEESLFPASFAPGTVGPSADVAPSSAPQIEDRRSAELNTAHAAFKVAPIDASEAEPPQVPADASVAALASEQPSSSQKGAPSIWSAAISGDPEPSAVPPPVASQSGAGNDVEQMSAPTPLVAGSDEKKETSFVARPAFVPDKPQAATSTAPARAILIPVIVGLAVAATVGGLLFWGESAVKDAKPDNGFVDPDEINNAKAQREMRALEKETAGSKAALVTVPARTALSQPVARQPVAVADPEQAQAQVAARREEPKTLKAGSRRRSPHRSAEAPSTPAEPAADYSAYGLRATDSAVTGNASVGGTKTSASTPTKANVSGIRIPVRLKGSIVSSPPGPIIAVVTKTTKFGDSTLKKGAEIHGETKGAKNGLIAVQFHAAYVGGIKVTFKGKALAPDGRAGIPAIRMSGGASDVAAAATEAALRSAGEGVAEVAGDNPLGAAIRGGTSPAAAKGRNLDNSSLGFKTRRNARFFVYVTGR